MLQSTGLMERHRGKAAARSAHIPFFSACFCRALCPAFLPALCACSMRLHLSAYRDALKQ